MPAQAGDRHGEGFFSPGGTGGEPVVDHIRLFPLRDDVRRTYRVHEQIRGMVQTIMDWSPRSRTSNPFSRSPVPMKADTPLRVRRAPGYQWKAGSRVLSYAG